MSSGGKVPWWGTASFFAACVLVDAVGGVLIDRRGPQLWAGVLLLACACAAMVWTAARNAPGPGAAKRTLREVLLGRSGERWDAGLRLWSWRNYPFLVAFTSFMLATREFDLLYGYWQALLITSGSALLVLVARRAWTGARGRGRGR